MLWWSFWSILVYFGAFWCTSCATSWFLHDLFRLLCPFECLSNPEIDHISQDKFETLCSVMLWWPLWSILVNFGAFWCTSCATPQSFHDLYWLLSPFMCPSNPEIDHISHSGRIQNTALSCYGDNFDPIWSILVYFSATHMHPHNPSMTCIDFYPFYLVSI